MTKQGPPGFLPILPKPVALPASGEAPKSAHVLNVNEHFGPTIQGEGPSAGQLCTFLRLAGCHVKCSWCHAPGTMVLMADWTQKPIEEVAVGDWVRSYRNRQYEVAQVVATGSREAEERVAVTFGSTTTITTPEHVYATPHQIDGRRRSEAGQLLGRHVRVSKFSGWGPDDEVRNEAWWTGWLQGVVLGDGHVGQSEASPYPKVWLRVIDKQLAQAFSDEVNRRGAKTTVREQKRRTNAGKTVYSVVFNVSRVPEAVGLPDDDRDQIAGFIAGFYDAEGYCGKHHIDMTQKDYKTIKRLREMLEFIGLGEGIHVTETERVSTLTITGLTQVDDFMRVTRPILDRKRTKQREDTRRFLRAEEVTSVIPVAGGTVHYLTTTTGFFFADGALVEQCDIPQSWDWDTYDREKESHPYSIEDAVALVHKLAPTSSSLLIVTGGEPLLQATALAEVFAAHEELYGYIPRLELETSGTRPLGATAGYWTRIVCSPKVIPSAQAPLGHHLDPALLRDERTIVKYVVLDEADLEAVEANVEKWGLPAHKVWLMPEGVSIRVLDERQPWLMQAAIDRGWNFTTRLQVYGWGDERGH